MREAKKGRRPRCEEDRAGELLTQILGADGWEANDDNSEDEMYDLSIVWSDGNRIAVEVTTDRDKAKTGWTGEMRKDSDGGLIMGESLRLRWQINALEGASYKRIRAVIESTLHNAEQTLERLHSITKVEFQPWLNLEGDPTIGEKSLETLHSITDFDFQPCEDLECDSDICKDLRNLHIWQVNGWSPCDPEDRGKIAIQPLKTEASFYGIRSLAEVAEYHIKENKCKLLKAQKDEVKETHLFIWLYGVDGRSPAALTQSLAGPLPGDKGKEIRLRQIDSVWLTAIDKPDKQQQKVHGDSYPVWRYSNNRWAYYVKVSQGTESVWQETQLG